MVGVLRKAGWMDECARRKGRIAFEWTWEWFCPHTGDRYLLRNDQLDHFASGVN